jgi:hypothetical protein
VRRASRGATEAPPAVVRPARGWFVLLDGGIAALVLLSASDRFYDAAIHYSPLPLPAQSQARRLLVGAIVIHAAEALGASRLARRHGLPARSWAAQTFVVGFPSLLALRRRLRQSAG